MNSKKSQQTISSVLRELGIDYRESGDEGVARCPAHKDKHPSWSCNLKTGVHHCFSCGYSGNLASLVSDLLKLSYADAVIWTNERVGWARAYQWREDFETKNFAPPHLNISEADLALFIKPPQEALESRGISAEAANSFGVLWNPERSSWILPVRNPLTNDLWGWQEKNERIFRNYPASIKKSESLFGFGNVVHGSTVVLVESPLDCLRLATVGIPGAVSSFGVHVSARQLSLIQSVTEHVVLALDNDSAGVSETARICKDAGTFTRLSVLMYHAKDPGEEDDKELRAFRSISSIRWLGIYNSIQRKFASVSDRTRREILIQKELTRSICDGPW